MEQNKIREARLDLRVKRIGFDEGFVGNLYGVREITYNETTGLSVSFCAGGGPGRAFPEKVWIPTKETGDEYK